MDGNGNVLKKDNFKWISITTNWIWTNISGNYIRSMKSSWYIVRFVILSSFGFQVYFMDTQIWYSVFCALFGGIYGILHHLGEVCLALPSLLLQKHVILCYVILVLLILYRYGQWECYEVDFSCYLLHLMLAWSRQI